MQNKPPHRAHQFLRWFCREEYLEEIEGDLLEVFDKEFEESPQQARRSFTLSVIRYFRPAFIKSFTPIDYLTTPTMLKSDLKISWRSLRKQPFFTFLNTFGLAIGIAGALLISLYIYDEFSFNKMFADSDRIYRLNIDHRNSGEVNKYAAVSGPLANVIREDYPQAELVTRFKNTESKFIRRPGTELNIKENHVIGVDSTFFEMFGIELIAGDTKTAFNEPNKLVITTTMAKTHFGDDNALGQTLIIDESQEFTISGIMKNLPENSLMRDLTVFMSLSSFEEANSLAWNNWTFPTFVKLSPSADPAHFEEYLNGVKDRYLIPWAMTFVPGLTVESARAAEEVTGDYMIFNSIPLTDIHLYSPNINEELSQNSHIQNIYIMAIIGVFLLLLACINFMNLSTAHSLNRAKEVGIRKTLGSKRFELVRQFLTEAGMVSFLSLVVAITGTYLILPYFNELAGKEITLPFQDPVFWILMVSMVIILGLISGSYPSMFLSRFVPVKVLKGNGQSQAGGGGIRNGLVVFQFSISIFLMVGTLIVFQQLSFMQNKDLGYQKDQVLVINDVNRIGDQVSVLKEQVQQLNEVEEVSLSGFLPTPSARNGMTFFPEGNVLEPQKALIMGAWRVDFDYISTLDLEIIAGRSFDKRFGTDSSSIILNESAVARLEITPDEALGLRLTRDFRRSDKENMEFLTVIGVVKNFHFETMRNSIDGMSFIIGNDPEKMIARLTPGNFSETISDIEEIWSVLSPGQPMEYYFMDDSFNDVYQAEVRLSKIFVIFTVISLVIACLGLFGLASFNAQKRIKEIGIRKVLGANVMQIVYRLSVDFLKLIAIAIAIALPLGWYAMSQWLQDFTYRVEMSVWIFILSALAAVVISILTISYQSIKAAFMNPVRSLKSE